MRTMRQMQAAAKWDTGFAKPEREPPVRVQRLVRRLGAFCACGRPLDGSHDHATCGPSIPACGTSGYEMRPTECVVVFDVKNCSKDYFRRLADGQVGEFVERREMTQADFQLALPKIEPEK